jgi:hypothetical protein
VVTDEDPNWLLCEDDEPVSGLPDDEDPLDDPVVVERLDAFVVVAAELAPRLPVAAITPKASAKVASAAAVTRRRIILRRRARARRRWRTRSGFEAMPAS